MDKYFPPINEKLPYVKKDINYTDNSVLLMNTVTDNIELLNIIKQRTEDDLNIIEVNGEKQFYLSCLTDTQVKKLEIYENNLALAKILQNNSFFYKKLTQYKKYVSIISKNIINNVKNKIVILDLSNITNIDLLESKILQPNNHKITHTNDKYKYFIFNKNTPKFYSYSPPHLFNKIYNPYHSSNVYNSSFDTYNTYNNTSYNTYNLNKHTDIKEKNTFDFRKKLPYLNDSKFINDNISKIDVNNTMQYRKLKKYGENKNNEYDVEKLKYDYHIL